MTPAILLDTSFLLPSFGVDTGERIRRCLRFLAEHRREVKVCYSRYSLLEAVFILLRMLRHDRLKPEEAFTMVEAGVSTVIYSLEAVSETPTVFREALKLYEMGHKDLFDNLLYSAAVASRAYLLTVDEQLRAFIQENKLQDITLDPENLPKKLS